MMLEKKATEFIEELSSKNPVPGGGGASAAVGALGAALGLMVGNLTVGKKKYAAVEEDVKSAMDQLQILKKKMIHLTDEDAKVFEPLSRAYGLPANTEEEKEEKARIMEEALLNATTAPLAIMETALEIEELLEELGEKGSVMAISDVGVGILFAHSAVEGASLNVFINTKSMKDKEKARELNLYAEKIILKSEELKEQIYQKVLGQLK